MGFFTRQADMQVTLYNYVSKHTTIRVYGHVHY